MGMEDALDGVKSYLTSNLEAALVVIEAARSVTIPRWIDIQTYLVQSRQLPMIIIMPAASEPDYLEEDAPSDVAWYTHEIALITMIAGSSPKEVMFDLIRYQEAYVALINTDNTFGSLFNRIRLGASDFDEVRDAQEEKKLIQVLFQLIEVREVL